MKKSVLVIGLAVLLLVPMASAGFFDFFTGRANSELGTNLTINIANTPPKVLDISIAGSTINPTEATTTLVNFSVLVDDHDGNFDIDNFSMVANFSRTNEPLREIFLGASPAAICDAGISPNVTTQNFTCQIEMYWFDEAATWTVDIILNDTSNAENFSTTSFTFASLTAFVLSPEVITFAEITPGTTDQVSDNDPTVLNNTGNFDVTDTNILINSTNLTGETVASSIIDANLFTVSNRTGSSVECVGAAMNGSAFQTVSNGTLIRGNFTLDDGTTGQEQLFHCLTSAVATLTKQTYSTSLNGPWTIKIQ